MIEVTDQISLGKQLKANPKVIALFYSSWCPFCRRFVPVFDAHAEKSNAAVYLKVKIDEDENPLWKTYSLEAVPSVILFENGQVSHRLDAGLGSGLNEKQFNKWIETI